MFDYYIYLDDDEEVISATFGITNDYTNSTIFESRAELFIYCVGLLPYDTAKSDETADALCEAIDTLEEGTPFVLTEGDVTFELYATKDAYGDISSIFLEISKAE